MEFEIDDFASACWRSEDDNAAGANHAPRWYADRIGGEHTGVWDPEGARQEQAPQPGQF
jgi:hypothetical protein